MAGIDDAYFSEEGLATYLGYKVQTLVNWRRAGSGPAWTRLGNKRVVYRKAAVESWLARREYTSTADERAAEALA